MWMDSMNWGSGLNKKEEVNSGQASIALSSLMGETEGAAASCSSYHDSSTRDCWSWQVPDLILSVLAGLAASLPALPKQSDNIHPTDRIPDPQKTKVAHPDSHGQESNHRKKISP